MFESEEEKKIDLKCEKRKTAPIIQYHSLKALNRSFQIYMHFKLIFSKKQNNQLF